MKLGKNMHNNAKFVLTQKKQFSMTSVVFYKTKTFEKMQKVNLNFKTLAPKVENAFNSLSIY